MWRSSNGVRLPSRPPKGGRVEPNITVLEDAWGEAELGDAPHYMYKEIYEQPMLCANALEAVLTERWEPDVLEVWALTTTPSSKRRTYACLDVAPQRSPQKSGRCSLRKWDESQPSRTSRVNFETTTP